MHTRDIDILVKPDFQEHGPELRAARGHTSIISSASIIAASAACAALSRISMPVKARLVLMPTCCLTISTAVFSVLIGGRGELMRAFVLIWVSSFTAGAAVYYLVRRLDLSFKMFQQLKRESSHDFLTSL